MKEAIVNISRNSHDEINITISDTRDIKKCLIVRFSLVQFALMITGRADLKGCVVTDRLTKGDFDV